MPSKGASFNRETRNKNFHFISFAFPLLVSLWLCLSLLNFSMDGKNFHNLPQNMRELHILSLFFRQDAWHIPFSLITSFSTPITLSLTDSIPLMALLVKILKINTFQYFGLWFLISYSLYVFFAYRICKDIFREHHLANLFGTLVFISMPFIWYHPFYIPWFAGLWVVLWAYSIFFKRKSYTSTEWIGVAFCSTLIHPFFSFIIFFIMIADIIHLYIYNHKISSLKAASSFSYLFTFIFIMLCLAGVFYTPSLLDYTNIIQPISFKNIISNTYNTSYLNIGTGVTIGFIVSIILAIVYAKKLSKYFHYYRALIGCLLFLFFGASLGGIKLTNDLIVQIPLGSWGHKITTAFLTSGVKFLIPLLLLIPIIINAIAFRLEKHKAFWGVCFLAGIVIIQIIYRPKEFIPHNYPAYQNLDIKTIEFLTDSQFISWVFLDDIMFNPDYYEQIAFYAFQNNKIINTAPVIRYPTKYKKYHSQLAIQFSLQKFQQDTVYFIPIKLFPKEFYKLGKVLEYKDYIFFKTY